MSKTNKEQYADLVKEVSPNSHLSKDCIRAFLVGGLICVLGQFITNTLLNMDLSKDNASMYTSMILIAISVFLTGIGLYSKLGKFAGAGSIVPITGFANSVAAPALEFKKEGLIFGLGSKMFVIAGAVIVYGISASIVYGIIYYLLK